MLDPHPRAQLCLIIQQYGQNIIAEPKRCRGMLSDLAPHHRLENNLLIAALEQKVAQELLQPSALIPINMQVDRLVKRLHDVLGIKEEFAYWAVESWALALGVNQSTVKTSSSTPQPIKEEKAYSVEGVRKKHPNAYAKWSATDDIYLRAKYTEGSTISELAKLLHRTEGAIQSRLTKLNVQPPLPTKTIPPSSTAQLRVGKFIVENGVATDTETDLMWCRFAHGQTWQNGTAVGDTEAVKWETAFDVAKRFNQQGGYAGYTDWRLPTIDELKTLIDKKLANYINAGVFPNNTVWFWSSSPINASYSQFAWAVNFKYGNCNNTSNGAVRLVRGVHKVAITSPPATVKTQIPPPVATNPSPTTVSPLIAKLGLRQVTPTSLQHTPVQPPPIVVTPPTPVMAKPLPMPSPVVAIPSTATPSSSFFAWWIAGFIFIATVYISSGSKPESNNAPEQRPVASVIPTLNPPQAVTRNTDCIGNCINGQGTLTYTNGDKYIGNFENGKAEGQGTFIYVDGGKYIGTFKNDKFDGQGTLAYADGNKYVGEFKNDKVDGQGILTYADGSKYVGEFKNGEIVQNNPQVTPQTDNSKLANVVSPPSKPSIQPNETQPRCIKGNCINGRGTQIYPDGSKYIGQFKNGLSEGQGTLLLPNGDKYVGKFKQDRFQQ